MTKAATTASRSHLSCGKLSRINLSIGEPLFRVERPRGWTGGIRAIANIRKKRASLPIPSGTRKCCVIKDRKRPMATKRAARSEIDWYLISIDRLKQIGLVLLLIVLALAGWWFFTNQKRNPRSSAEAAITDAREALNALASSKD